MSHVALVVVDVQKDFLDPTSADVGSWKKAFCVSGIRQLLGFARERGWQVIHVGTRHDGSASLPAHQKRRGLDPYCASGPPGDDFVVSPGADDIILFKQWYSAFDADLEQHLDGIETVVWAGVATDCCIHQSAFDGDRRDLRNLIPIQAVSASDRSAFVASLLGLSKSAAEIVDLNELVLGNINALDRKAIEEIADRWFDDQESRLHSRGSDHDQLDRVLERLANDA